MSRGTTLPRRTMGFFVLVTVAVVASSPQTVLNGGVTTMYRQLGVIGVPLAFLVVMAVLWVMAVGYVAVARHVPHGAPFYAQLAHGFGPIAGLVGGAVAAVGYNALQISLYPLLGTTVCQLTGVSPGWWWIPAFVDWLVVWVLGQYPGAVNVQVLGVLLALELSVIWLFTAAGFAHPASGAITLAVFHPGNLLVTDAFAGVLVFAVASFAGWESVLAYAEEAKIGRDDLGWRDDLGRAARWSIVLCGVTYCLMAWSYGEWIGFADLQTAAGQASNQPLALLGRVAGPGIAALATGLLVTSVLAAQTSLHGTFARYVFAMARENVLRERWTALTRGPKGGAPVGGTRVQTFLAAVVGGLFLVCGADPMNTMFTWLSAIGAFCVALMWTASSWSSFAYFKKGGGSNEPARVREVGPVAGGVLGILAVVFMASSLDKLLGTPPGSALPWLVAAPIGGASAVAVGFGLWLRRNRPEVFAGIGRGVPDGATVHDDFLEGVEV